MKVLGEGLIVAAILICAFFVDKKDFWNDWIFLVVLVLTVAGAGLAAIGQIRKEREYAKALAKGTCEKYGENQ